MAIIVADMIARACLYEPDPEPEPAPAPPPAPRPAVDGFGVAASSTFADVLASFRSFEAAMDRLRHVTDGGSQCPA